jgi:hypothetical protein
LSLTSTTVQRGRRREEKEVLERFRPGRKKEMESKEREEREVLHHRLLLIIRVARRGGVLFEKT